MNRNKEAASDLTRSEKSLRTDEESDDESVDRGLSNIESTRDSFDKKLCGDRESSENQVSVPCLNLSKASTSNSEKDVFSTPMIDFILGGKRLASDVYTSNKDQIFEKMTEKEDKFIKKCLALWSESKDKTVNNQRTCGDDEKDSSREKDTLGTALRIIEKAVSENNVDKKGASVLKKNSERKDRSAWGVKRQRSNLPRTSSSVPWIRAKHSYRKKLRGCELKPGRRVEQPAGDGHLAFAAAR